MWVGSRRNPPAPTIPASGCQDRRTLMRGEVFGRERELESVSAFLDRSAEGLAGLVLEGVLRALAAPRRRALEVALLREDAAAGETVDPRALGVATRDALRSLAGDRRLLLAIDDVQWLDDASARALAFALRRSGDEQV